MGSFTSVAPTPRVAITWASWEISRTLWISSLPPQLPRITSRSDFEIYDSVRSTQKAWPRCTSTLGATPRSAILNCPRRIGDVTSAKALERGHAIVIVIEEVPLDGLAGGVEQVRQRKL